VGGGSCALCYSCLDFSVLSVVAGNLLGMADGPTWQPKPTGRNWLPCPILKHELKNSLAYAGVIRNFHVRCCFFQSFDAASFNPQFSQLKQVPQLVLNLYNKSKTDKIRQQNEFYIKL